MQGQQSDTGVSLAEQAARFDGEALEYDKRHSNESALAYRDRFYRNRLCDFDMKGLEVLDAMCATGIDTPYLASRGAVVQGLDISSKCAAIYKERFGLPCVVRSIHETGFEDSSFDMVYVSGGLHHVTGMLEPALKEIHRVLRTNGHLCFLEPNADSWADAARRLWYSQSEQFGSDERALSYKSDLRPLLSLGFKEEEYFTGGNIAYMLIQQANVLKTPDFILKHFKQPLFMAEQIMNFIPGAPKLFLCARWRKLA